MFNKVLEAVLLVTCVALIEVKSSASTICSDDPSSVNVAVIGRKNPSGRWVSQVVVGDGDPAKSPNLDVDVEYKRKECGAEESNSEITITFSVPPENGGYTNPTGRHSTLPKSECQCATQEHRRNPYTKPKHPPGGYMPLHGVAYFRIYLTPLIWSLARQKCIEDGGYLASINTPEKLSFVKGLNALGNWAWIDLHERGVNGVYYNVTGQKWEQPTFLTWYPGQPNFPGSSDCILLLLNDGRIGDTPCEMHQRMYICEIPWF